MLFSREESHKLDFIRAVSIILIIATHMFQAYGSELCYWTNTAVYTFLCLSGFLLGQERPNNYFMWFKKRLLRILPAYYIFLILAILLYKYAAGRTLSLGATIGYFSTLHMLFGIDIPGFNHLWYVTAIVLCYLLFSVLWKLDDVAGNRFRLLYFLIFPLIGLILQCIFIYPYRNNLYLYPYRLFSDISAFVMGFGLARIYKTKLSSYALKTAVVVSVIAVVLRIIYNYSTPETETWHKFSRFMIEPWSRCAMGVSLFVILYYLKTDVVADNWSCRFISSNSYEIYLTHPFIILGYLSVLQLTGNTVVNIGLVIVITLTASAIIHYMAAEVVAGFGKITVVRV